MATLTEYFEQEARDCLAELDRNLERPVTDVRAIQQVARNLRGSAQLAREDRVVRVAAALESAARAASDGIHRWSDTSTQRARDTIADLRALVQREQDGEELDAIAENAIARWRAAGIELPVPPERRAADTASSASAEFRAFAAGEVSAIAEALDRGVQQLSSSPMDREPLKMILRRQRALLGAARLEEIAVVSEILRAVDDLTRVIAKLDVGVKREWLDIYRVAREALRATIEPLQRDEDPPATHALSRLRHMREELPERYGTGEAVSAAHESTGFTKATTIDVADQGEAQRGSEETDVETAASPDARSLIDTPQQERLSPAGDGGEAGREEESVLLLEDELVLELTEDSVVIDDSSASAPPEQPAAALTADDTATTGEAVPIETLLYEREAALRRALDLRDAVTRAGSIDAATRDAIEELFDLIAIALR